MFKRWLFEIVSVTTSAVCMGAIVGLLYYLDNQSLSKWPPGLTLITILSKIASAALILPISEAIGQLKWTWFHGKKSRDAFDFEIFDKASRGAWGSVMLLCRTKGKSLAALGALLTVLLLAIDTFFQQVTDLPERWRLQGDSFIPRSIRYEPNVEFAYDNTWGDVPVAQTNNNLRRAIVPFFYDSNGTHPLQTGDAVQAEIPLGCPTSQCQWPTYQSLGLCSSCADASHLLKYACLTMRMDWIRHSTGPGTESTYPNGTACGYFLNATGEAPVLMSGYRVDNSIDSSRGETLLMRTLPLVTNPLRNSLYGGSINFRHIQHPLLDALIVSAADGSVDSVYTKKLPVAQECVLSWCVKTLRSSYSWGGYKEEVVNTFLNTTSAEWPWSTRVWPELDMTETGFRANITIVPPSIDGNTTVFGISNVTFLDGTSILDEIFPSMLTVSNASAPPFIKVRTSFTDKVMFRAVRFSPWLAPNNVTHHMERMAQAMTNMIRSDSSSNDLITGTAYTSETYVAVHWAWLTFPLIMLLLSIVFLVATIIKTSGDSHGNIGTWKTSTMPTLIYSLPKETRTQLNPSSSWNSAQEKSKEVRIRLSMKTGWRVSGQNPSNTSPQLPQRAAQAPQGWI